MGLFLHLVERANTAQFYLQTSVQFTKIFCVCLFTVRPTQTLTLCKRVSISSIKFHCGVCVSHLNADVLWEQGPPTLGLKLCFIMAGTGDRRTADACLPAHWRDVRDWSIEKRQSHGVRRTCYTVLCGKTLNYTLTSQRITTGCVVSL